MLDSFTHKHSIWLSEASDFHHSVLLAATAEAGTEQSRNTSIGQKQHLTNSNVKQAGNLQAKTEEMLPFKSSQHCDSDTELTFFIVKCSQSF